MAKEKKLVESITAREVDFAQWYTDVVREAKLCDYSGVKGCLNYLPNGYAIWENIQANLDKRFKETGVENVYLPVLIPENLLQKEKDHIEGFAPEVAWVTHGGMEELQERFCIRPTSETLFCDLWSKTVQSYRDLPKVWNQWCSVLRWEKTTRPFLRSREFLWQEGHTIHATYEEAEERTLLMRDVYKSFVEDDLAIPLVTGRKTPSEKFAGAQDTYTIEALMHDGKALQSGTSHFFGNAFADAYGISYSDKENKLHSVYETSWGLSTRIIGAIIMVHGDDSGLVLPPHLAPIQVVIVPIYKNAEMLAKIDEKVAGIVAKLKSMGISVKYDNADNKRPGFKFADYEVKGVPVRLVMGGRDLENNTMEIMRRDTLEKETRSCEGIEEYVKDLLEDIQANVYKKALDYRNSRITSVDSYEEFKEKIEEGGFILAHWDGTTETEEKIKEETKATIRCIPFDSFVPGDKEPGKCMVTGKPSACRVIFARSY